MSLKSKLAVLTCLVGTLLWMGSPANAYGPPPQAPIVSCSGQKLDPPPVSWIGVTFAGKAGAPGGEVPYSYTVKYGSPTPHWAIVNHAYYGHVHIVSVGSWTLGPGHTAVTDVTLDCGSDPASSGGTLPFTGGYILRAAGIGLFGFGGGTACIIYGRKRRRR